MPSKFATAFKYSRFDATAARPRDPSALSGERVRGDRPTAASEATADVADNEGS